MLRLLLHRLVHLRTRWPGEWFRPRSENKTPFPHRYICAPHPPTPWALTPNAFPAHPVPQLFMYTILNSGGEWYLGVSKEDAPAAASACLIAAGVYGLYLVYCGLKLGKAPKAVKDDEEA